MARTSKRAIDATRLTGKSQVGDVVRHGVAVSDASLARLRGGAATADADRVHHFRTTLRRLRSLLSSFKAVAPPAERTHLSDRLKELSQRYGKSRQWDVLIEALDKAFDGGADRSRIADAAKRRRRSLTRGDGPRLNRDIASIDRAILAADWLHAPSPGEAELWNAALDDFVPDLLDRQRRRLRQRSRHVDLSDAAAFHEFRIAAKKHRYTIEFLASRYRKKAVKPYLRRLVAIQDVLGALRDAQAGAELLGELALTPAARAAAATWLERRAAECRARFPTESKAFRREKPFWEQ